MGGVLVFLGLVLNPLVFAQVVLNPGPEYSVPIHTTVGEYTLQVECRDGTASAIFPGIHTTQTLIMNIDVDTVCANHDGFRRWKKVANAHAGETITEIED